MQGGAAGQRRKKRKRTGTRGVLLPSEITGVVMRKDSSWLRSHPLDRRRLVSNQFGIEGLPCGVDRATYR